MTDNKNNNLEDLEWKLIVLWEEISNLENDIIEIKSSIEIESSKTNINDNKLEELNIKLNEKNIRLSHLESEIDSISKSMSNNLLDWSSDNLNNKKTFREDVIDFLKDLAIVIIIVLFIRSFLVLPFQISGQSMYSSYYDKEFIIVDVFSYLNIPLLWQFDGPQRWDVIVFRPRVNENKEYYIKRIIALEWDTLKLKDWDVFLKKEWEEDFVQLDEQYLNATNYWKTFILGSLNIKEHEYKVPEDSYFVMWDNRNWSSDSRTCFVWRCEPFGHSNFIKSEDIVWKVLLDLWYFNFKSFSFRHPYLWIDTSPKFFSSPDSYDYE